MKEKKKTQTTKTCLVKTVCASLKVVRHAGGKPGNLSEGQKQEGEDYSRVFTVERNYGMFGVQARKHKAGKDDGRREALTTREALLGKPPCNRLSCLKQAGLP